MIFSRLKKQKSALGVSLLACLAFIALAVWGWDLPLEAAFSYLLISIVLMMAIMVMAFISAWLLSLLRDR